MIKPVKEKKENPSIAVTDTIKIELQNGVNYALQVMRVWGPESKNAGESYWETVGNYATVKLALLGILRNDILINWDEVDTLEDYIKSFEKASGAIVQKINQSEEKLTKALDIKEGSK